MSHVVFQRAYYLNKAYAGIKERADQILGRYQEYPDIFTFNDRDRSLTFSSERLIPAPSTNRPRLMLLFANPHPFSVYQGMFLSPNRIGRENLFWPVMEASGWIGVAPENCNPWQLADICLEAAYPGPFELIFYCYYAFPTNLPDEIRKIFGVEYFSQVIEPEAREEFRKVVRDVSVEAVVTFNKQIFNLVSADRVEAYIERLKEGELIRSQVKDIDGCIPIFLTFPTGWRFHAQYMQFRKASLDRIRRAICSEVRSDVK